MSVAEKLTSIHAELVKIQAGLNRILGKAPEPFWLSAIRTGGCLIQLFCIGAELGYTLSRSDGEFLGTKKLRLMMTQFSTVDDDDSFDIVLMTMKGCKAPETFITWMETEKKNIITACKDYHLLLTLTPFLIKTAEELRDQKRRDAKIRDAARTTLMSTIEKINENIGAAAISTMNEIRETINGCTRSESASSFSSSNGSVSITRCVSEPVATESS